MTVTLQDCQKMLGLRIHGKAVTGQCMPEGWRARVEAFLDREAGEQGACTSGVLISWLQQEFAQCPEEADEEIVGYNYRAWILHLFARILFPDATGDTASWMWVHCLSDWDQVSWESYDGEGALPFHLSNMCEFDDNFYRMRTDTTQDVYVLSTGRGGLDSSSQTATGDEDEDEDDNNVD
ncbi:protein MAIN-LIKE 2-like [Miscanthus floridulus]|uniref:protein MAIN-LIKE 2-like n=1 Tax=Miscanthus floridulus TaxID=154761 RepID=UPI00345777EA